MSIRVLVAASLSLTGASVHADKVQAATIKPVISSFLAAPKKLPYAGGVVVLVATVKNATTCTFGGAFTKRVACQSGVAVVEEEVAGNTSINSKAIGVTLKVSGPGGNTGPRSASIEEAGKPVGTTTTAPVTSTTVPTGTMCTGPCKFSLPSSDALGFTTVAMNSVSVGASCPDPGSCDATSAQQIADVNITLCAGPAGSTAADSEDTHFVLKVAGGAAARRDSVTFDSSVQGSLGLYGPIGAEECIAADIYYDIPKGATWTALNYEYFQTSATAPSLYTWKN